MDYDGITEGVQYETADCLRECLESLKGKKFLLDCGHRVTFGYHLGANVVIVNGKTLKLLCSECAS